jgi:hypothetical protein
MPLWIHSDAAAGALEVEAILGLNGLKAIRDTQDGAKRTASAG